MQRISEEIDGVDIFTYDTDLLAEAHTMRKPELLLLAKGRKYSGLYKLNKAELAIIVADTLTAERDEKRAKTENITNLIEHLHSLALEANTKLTQIERLERHPSQEARIEAYALRDELIALGFKELAINDTPRTRSESSLTTPAFDEEAVYASAEVPQFSPEFLKQQAENEAAYARIPALPTAEGITEKLVSGLRALADENTPRRPKMDRYCSWAMSHPLVPGGDGNVMQGHVDYCADWGHATYTDNGRVSGVCPRCGDRLTDDVRMAKQAFEDAHRIAAEVLGGQQPKAKPVRVMALRQHGNELYVFEGTDGPSVWLRKENGALTWETRCAFEANYRAVCVHGKGRDCWLCPAAAEIQADDYAIARGTRPGMTTLGYVPADTLAKGNRVAVVLFNATTKKDQLHLGTVEGHHMDAVYVKRAADGVMMLTNRIAGVLAPGTVDFGALNAKLITDREAAESALQRVRENLAYVRGGLVARGADGRISASFVARQIEGAIEDAR